MRFKTPKIPPGSTLLGTWLVTHVPSDRSLQQQAFVAVAVREEQARRLTHLKTGHPYTELYAVLIRRDEAPVSQDQWNPGLERCLGPLRDYAPQRNRACSSCAGKGYVKRYSSPTDPHFEWVECQACEGTGIRRRRIVE